MALYYPAWPCEDLLVTPSQNSWSHFHGALARVDKAAGNSSHTAGQVGLALGAMEPGKD